MDITKLTAAAVAALALGGCAHNHKTPMVQASETKSDAKGECWGVNGCKGKGACGGVGHECAGNNECKGHGWLSLTKSECDAQKGKFKGG